MKEGNIDPKVLEDAVQNALKNYFPPLESADARVGFYNKFKRKADEHDSDFLKKYGGDLDITLLFAGLFSGLASGFIAAIGTGLRPDYTQMSYNVLTIIANATLHNIPPGQGTPFPQWRGPDPTLVNVQAMLFSSLAVSLFAAFVAMLGKQWLNRYSQIDMRGSLIDRSRDQQRKIDGMATWGFKFIMESLPVMLQVALLLFSCALSQYLLTVDSLIARVVVGFTVSGFLFYLFIVVSATICYDCPFQTPLSRLIRFIIHLFSEREKHIKESKRWLSRTFRKGRGRRRRRQPGGPRNFTTPGMFNQNNPNEHFQLPTVGLLRSLPVSFGKEADWDGHMLDSNCIAWMFKMCTDSDGILDIMKFIPEVVWHGGIQNIPLEKLYDTVLECFDHSSESPILIPRFRNKAYLSAKALLHITIQRECMGDRSNKDVFRSISRRHLVIGSRHYEGDSDLEFALGMIDCVFGGGGSEPMRWQEFSFTSPHHTWMSRILRFRASKVLQEGQPLPDDTTGFLLHSLGLRTPPLAPVVTDCLCIIGLVLGITLDDGDHGDVDISLQINRIYNKLTGTFQDITSTPTEVDRALNALEFITSLPNNEVATESYKLFCVTMQTPISYAYTEESKWKASRLALHGAYKSHQSLPQVENPRDFLSFLDHHFEMATQDGEEWDEPIQNALRALISASGPVMGEALEHFDPTKPSFVSGILRVFQKSKPLQLRKAALFFLPLIADRWFNIPPPSMDADKTRSLCVDWASAVDDVWGTDDVREPALAVLLDMINSSHWRSHIVADKWKLLEHFGSVPDNSQPLARCLENPDLVGAISKVETPDAIVLWSMVLWSKYNKLAPAVQVQLEAATKGAQEEAINEYLLVITRELREAKAKLLGYDVTSTNPEVATLKVKIDGLERALTCLKTD